MHSKRRIAVLSTGGTIEKTYDELAGVLENRFNVLDIMVAQLQLGGVELHRETLMNKDSLQMSDADHQRIAEAARDLAMTHDGVVVVHGTDRLAQTGERCHDLTAGAPASPIVLTGAMRPYELRHTDALQNLTEALMAVQLLAPGIYAVMHNRCLRFPGVVKDRAARTFAHARELAEAPSSRRIQVRTVSGVTTMTLDSLEAGMAPLTAPPGALESVRDAADNDAQTVGREDGPAAPDPGAAADPEPAP